ncbi:MAG: hypothetical protein AAB265_16590, partial [candidate division NC10 bacterium]
MSTTGNRYCERAGLTSVPRVQDVLGRDEVNLFHVMVVALLERGGPMTVEEMEGVLAGMTRHRSHLAADRVRSWRSPLVSLDESGRLRLDRGAPDLGAMRQAVRKLARPVLLQHARQEQWAKVRGEQETLLAEERRLQAQQAARLRRGVLRAVPEAEAPQAISLLDVGTRSIRTFVGSELAAVAGVLADLDLLAGLRVRETLHGLGLDPDRWRLVDLKPPQKSRRINRRGRTLTITPELLISSTTGISRPLGEPARVAQYLAGGETGKLTRRLESDVKALHAFYRYGLLHHCVRLRWGFLDEMFPVDWALPGEPHLHEILEGAKAAGAPVDLVVGSAPGWADPWSRARRGAILEVEPWQVTVRLDGEVWRLDRG